MSNAAQNQPRQRDGKFASTGKPAMSAPMETEVPPQFEPAIVEALGSTNEVIEKLQSLADDVDSLEQQVQAIRKQPFDAAQICNQIHVERYVNTVIRNVRSANYFVAAERNVPPTPSRG